MNLTYAKTFLSISASLIPGYIPVIIPGNKIQYKKFIINHLKDKINYKIPVVIPVFNPKTISILNFIAGNNQI